MTKKETIVVLGAHSDDFVIGAGGTIARYTAEGKEVLAIVFSKGEKTHPWIKRKVVQDFREAEAILACKLLKCKIKFLGLGDLNVGKEYQKKQLEKKLLPFLEQLDPSKILTHSHNDLHPDHQEVNKITLQLWEKMKVKPEVYIYSIWNPLSLSGQYPTLYIDITKQFGKKLKAMNLFRSQRLAAIYPLLLFVFYRAIANGLKIRKMFAESFYRIK